MSLTTFGTGEGFPLEGPAKTPVGQRAVPTGTGTPVPVGALCTPQGLPAALGVGYDVRSLLMEFPLERIHTDSAPAPRGHYSQAVVHGGIVYVAGQLPGDPGDPEAPYPESVSDQTKAVIRNISAILAEAGSSLSQVLQLTVYVSDPSYWGDVNVVFAEAFGAHKPARAIVPVGDLKGAALEVQAVAFC